MPPSEELRAGPVLIPASELIVKASRAGGPGGQHVNTSSTRIEVRWNVDTSRALTDTQRDRLRHHLATRIDGQGWLRVVSGATRSQLQNREAATRRLLELVARGLRVPKTRKPTRVPRAVRARRLEEKRRRGAVKRERRRGPDEE